MSLNIPAYLMAKNGNIPVGAEPFDIPAYLMAKAASGGIQEVSGTLPLTVRSRASQILKNYIIYGTASGAGVETENELNPTMTTGYPKTSIGAKQDSWTGTGSGTVYTYPIEPNTDYCLYSDLNRTGMAFYRVAMTNADPPAPDDIVNAPWILHGTAITNVAFNSDVNTKLLIQVPITYDAEYLWQHLSLVKASVIPDVFIPYGYKLPITVTSNGTTTDYPVYIGDSQLMAEEYVDYESGKVYKRTENLWDGKGTSLTNRQVTSTGSICSTFVITTPGTYTAKCFLDHIGTAYVYCKTYTISTDTYGPAKYLSLPEASAAQTVTVTETVDNDTVLLIYNPLSSNITTTAELFIETQLCVVLGSTPPESYIPYLQPTDPPVPLPDISLPQGEVTIDIDEDIKPQATIEGKIKQI